MRRRGRGPVRLAGILRAAAVALPVVGAACAGPKRVVPALPPLPELPAVDPQGVPPAGSVPAMPPVVASAAIVRAGGDTAALAWSTVSAYLEALGRASPRLRVDTIGRSTLGRPLVVATIASPGTLARLELHQSVQQRFADPRRVPSADELERMIARGRTVLAVVGGAHGDEPGAAAAALRLAHRLASADGPSERAILAGAIVLLVPSLNPDGIDRIAAWRERARGRIWADAPPSLLAHPYAGDALASDLPGLTQVETRLLVEKVLRPWHPHAVHLIGSPPRVARSRSGVAGAPSDSTAPELESARSPLAGPDASRSLAPTPAAADLDRRASDWPNLFSPLAIIGEVAVGRSVARVRPRQGAVPGSPPPALADRPEAAEFALLETAAARREPWLRAGLAAARAAVGPDTGAFAAAWVLRPAAESTRAAGGGAPGAGVGADPRRSGDSPGLSEFVRMLSTAGVDVRRVTMSFHAGGREVTAGFYIVPVHQSRARLARALLGPADASADLASAAAPPDPPSAAGPFRAALLGVQVVPITLTDRRMEHLPLSGRLEGPKVRRVAVGLTGAGAAAPRIALYRSPVPSADEGWTRWILDAHRVPHTVVGDDDVRRAGLRDRFDVLVLPSEVSAAIYDGRPPGTAPEAQTDGLGAAGTAVVAAFVRAGGTLVTLGQASRYAIDYLGIPVRDGALRSPDSGADSTVATILVDTTHVIGAGVAPAVPASGEGAFELRPTGPAARTVARYAADGRGAVVAVEGEGRGRIVLFGFVPHYRGSSGPALPLFFNALK